MNNNHQQQKTANITEKHLKYNWKRQQWNHNRTGNNFASFNFNKICNKLQKAA